MKAHLDHASSTLLKEDRRRAWRTASPLCRRLLSLLVLAAALALGSRRVSAGGSAIPPAVQATLSAKLASFDRSLFLREGDRLVVLVVRMKDDAASARAATEFQQALERIPRIAGLPHEERAVVFSTTASLVEQIRRDGPGIVYLSEGFERTTTEIAAALVGVNVLTVAAEPGAVVRGAIAGFDLVSGQSKLLVNLAQARRQNVELASAVLRIAVILGGS